MNYKNKPSLFKRESFYIILFLVLAIVVTIIAIAVRNSSSKEGSSATGDTTAINSSSIASVPNSNLSSSLVDTQGPANTLEVKNNGDNTVANNNPPSDQTSAIVPDNTDTAAVDATPATDSASVSTDNNSVSSNANVTDANANAIDSTQPDVALDSTDATAANAAVSTFSCIKPLAGEIITNYDDMIKGTAVNGNQWITFSNGIEISAPVSAPVMASADGQVISITKDLNGAIVTIDDGNGFKTVYKNLDPACLLVNKGDTVTQNQQIGNIGAVTDAYVDKGPRLSFEIIRNDQYQDPLKYIR
ncbi:MAG: peptidoglycan DD-metalloendopeptidase family protein [Oscillospiraceae bacterium]|nr:peptidoglycan DD-metalloendopeptidase family protein [Oscillospiraceae bacterium]